MTWYIDETKHYPIIDEIEKKQTDRGAAIMAAALLEGYLLKAIGTRLFVEGEYNNNIRKQFCGIDGALGSFGSRIHAGFLLGLYLQDAHSDLQSIARIRNYFAHRSRVLTFEHQDIKRLCKQFILIRRIAHAQMMTTAKSGSPPPTINKIATFVNNQPMRWQFIRTVQVIIGLLIKQTSQPPPLPTLPTPF